MLSLRSRLSVALPKLLMLWTNTHPGGSETDGYGLPRSPSAVVSASASAAAAFSHSLCVVMVCEPQLPDVRKLNRPAAAMRPGTSGGMGGDAGGEGGMSSQMHWSIEEQEPVLLASLSRRL